jgi:hypothetical protein
MLCRDAYSRGGIMTSSTTNSTPIQTSASAASAIMPSCIPRQGRRRERCDALHVAVALRVLDERRPLPLGHGVDATSRRNRAAGRAVGRARPPRRHLALHVRLLLA